MSLKRSGQSGKSFSDAKQTKLDIISPVSWQINGRYRSETILKPLKEAWTARKHFEEDGLKLSQVPFCHCEMPGFLEDSHRLDELQTELLDLEFAQKNNDLYKFIQTKEDLKTSEAPSITAFRKMICSTFRDWLKEVTSIPLNDTVDMFCAQYQHTDTLLCHDDELEGRRIAYIFYLVSSWTEKDGGTLDLYNVDEHVQPVDVVKSIVPTRNSLMFFEVSPGSYHQVAEVLSEDKIRLSVGGWFHGPPIQRPSPYLEKPRELHPYQAIEVAEVLSEDKIRLSVGGWFHGPPIQRPSPYLEKPRELHPYQAIEDDEFFSWVNPAYLDIGVQSSIGEKFESESEIELTDFLQAERYEALKLALQADVEWKKRGPPNKRCYYEANKDTCPAILKSCLDLLQSDALFLVLSNLTGLKLHELAGSDSESSSDSENGERENSQPKSTDKECTSRCRSEVRRWQQGCYTLVHDTDTEGLEFALDLVLYVGCQGWESDFGGFTSYIAKGEDEELLTVQPKENSLALVYRDRDTLKFVKHVNSSVNKMPNKGFYDISAVYYE